MGKMKDLFKKIGKIEGTFYARMGTSFLFSLAFHFSSFLSYL